MLLCAVYESAIIEHFDTENILFCNVDPTSGLFAHLTREGLRFERSFADPRGAEQPFLHRMTYTFAPASSPSVRWHRLGDFAAWAPISCPDPGTITRAAPLWWMFRTTPCTMLGTKPMVSHFGIKLVLHVPPGATCNVAAVLKPAIDGATTALACDDGRSPEPGVETLAHNLNKSPDEVGALLLDGVEILGRSRLLDRAGRMQAPDHNCVFGELVTSPGEAGGWKLAAELFEVQAL